MSRYEWREQYAICEHVARMTHEQADAPEGTRHSGFRVCCESCWIAGFLYREDLTREADIGGFAVRSLPPAALEQGVKP